MIKDTLTKALIFDKHARLLIVTSTETVENARSTQTLWPVASISLGKVLTGALLMTGLEKNIASVSLRIEGGGPLGTILATATKDTVRGYVENGEVHIANNNQSLNTGFAVGNNGTITVLKEQIDGSHFTSACEIQTGEIAEDLAFYYLQSEQTPTSVILSVTIETDNSVKTAGGILIQLLPNCPEDIISLIEEKLKTFPQLSTLLQKNLSHEQIIELITDGNYQITEKYPVSFFCPCTKERFVKSLKTIPRKEIRLMIKDGKDIETICNFCHQKHIVELEDLKKIYFRR
ncbi:MAG: Hsp33 family molecular chaperone HslO [Erysipelotrichales bacterium]|nr:Hsp33 family molecular chaperone HslO [Erysipelotrichales bacterium]